MKDKCPTWEGVLKKEKIVKLHKYFSRKGLFTYYVSLNVGVRRPPLLVRFPASLAFGSTSGLGNLTTPSPPRQQWSTFG